MHGFQVRVMAGAALLLSFGCAQVDGPLGVERTGGQDPRSVQATLTCTVATRTASLHCNTLSASLPGGVSGALIGGQGTYLLLESSNVRYDAGSAIFAAEVTVRNFLTQTLGAIVEDEAVSVDPEGIRVFFLDEPQVTGGIGEVVVANPTGHGAFTSTDQAYFQYDQALSPGQRSLPQEWQWQVPGTVEGFSFTVGVSARVVDEGAVNPGLRFVAGAISAGVSHTCVLTLDGAAYCWGKGSAGQLGTGTNTGQLTPVRVVDSADGPLELAVLSAGRAHTCGLTTSGAAYCWGAGDSGQLGSGEPLAGSDTPVAVQGGQVFLALSAGADHACGVTTGGTAYCWGQGARGRLGNGTLDPTPVAEPGAVSGGLTFASIGAGAEHTCGLTNAGKAVCWGNSQYGQVGNGDSTASATPVAVADPADGPVDFTSISSGVWHTCALATTGSAYCWGANNAGQLGMGDSTVVAGFTPVAVTGGLKFVAITAGAYHSCGITKSGAAYCWGLGIAGQLGIGDTLGRPKAAPVPVAGNHRFTSISGGELHTCAVTASGEIFCWGNGEDGRLGNGAIAPQIEPAPVAALHRP